MKKITILFLSVVVAFSLIACDSSAHEGEAKTPSGSRIMKGRDYQDVVNEFKEQGFTNIKTEKIEDLITGWLTDDGEVEEVAVDGDVEYGADEWMPEDAEVVIRYHTFPEDTEDTEETEETEKTVEDKPDSAKEETEIEDAEGDKTYLTADNCPELAAILTTHDEFDPQIGLFATKYSGRIIEFDGYTADVSHNGNYKTRFNYLLYAGDYSETEVVGPAFRISDVNYSDLNLVGEGVPDTFGVGLNIHITAKVGAYSEGTGLFEIEPIAIRMR